MVSVSNNESPAYLGLASQYGLSDEMDIQAGDFDPIQQTAEQEYQAYLKSPSTLKTANIIKYWEVVGEFDVLNQSLTKHRR